MDKGVIAKDEWRDWLAGLADRVYGPVRDADGTVSLAALDAGRELVLDYGNLRLPLKRQVFPWCEVVGGYDAEGMHAARLSDEQTVVFGVRPCDAASLCLLDHVFAEPGSVDPYYRARREALCVIVLACARPAQTCFCGSVGGGPAGVRGADILAVDLGDRLLLEAVSEKGQALLSAHAAGLAAPGKADIDERAAQAAAAEKNLGAVSLAAADARLKAAFDAEAWEAIGLRCLGCGACTYLCPTCHCFGIHDETVGARGRRIRVQDACMFAGFTLEASGHNPRGTQGARMRQRILHKFCYTVENFAEVFCVGCGRCITACPVNIDIRETVDEVTK